MRDVLVLGYHAVSERWPASLSIAPGTWRRTFACSPTGALWASPSTRPSCGRRAPKTLAITFDDAYRSVFELAFPIISRAGFKATVFAPTAFVGSEEPMAWPGIDHWRDTEHASELMPMSWEELGHLAAAGWEIGSHTHSHPRLPELDDAALA